MRMLFAYTTMFSTLEWCLFEAVSSTSDHNAFHLYYYVSALEGCLFSFSKKDGDAIPITYESSSYLAILNPSRYLASPWSAPKTSEQHENTDFSVPAYPELEAP